MRWLVLDSLYCREQWFCSHLDSMSHYLCEVSEDAEALCLNIAGVPGTVSGPTEPPDVVMALDQFDHVASVVDLMRLGSSRKPTITIAQVAAICSPMPWEVHKADGSPAYDCVISSIPWMAEAARAAGCRAEYMPLAFDHRALSCSMGVDRDIGCLFVGTVDGNHTKRAEVLRGLGDHVTIAPPAFGRDYYRLVSRARVLIHVGAEWSRGSANALRLFEGGGLGCEVVSDGRWDGPGEGWWHSPSSWGNDWKTAAFEAARYPKKPQRLVLAEHGYHKRIPRLIEIARSL